eukprot:g18263.t1
MRIYQAMPQCVALVLCPCCSLRSLDIKRAERLCLPESLVAQGAVNSYDQWVSALLELLPEATCYHLQALHAEQKIEVIWSLAQLHARGAAQEFRETCMQDAWETTKLQRLAPEDLTRLASSFARLDLPDRGSNMAKALASSALPTVEAFDPPDLTRLANALCRTCCAVGLLGG